MGQRGFRIYRIMHELAIAQSILKGAREEASSRGLPGVSRIGVRVGALSGVLPDALTVCFEAVAMDEGMPDVRLVLEEVPLTGLCRTCSHPFDIVDLYFRCPECESVDVETTGGMDLSIAWLETDAEPMLSESQPVGDHV